MDNNDRVVPLNAPCAADSAEAVVYAGAVFLFCSNREYLHTLGTMMSTSLTLSSWNGPLDDGSLDVADEFPVNRMAVP